MKKEIVLILVCTLSFSFTPFGYDFSTFQGRCMGVSMLGLLTLKKERISSACSMIRNDYSLTCVSFARVLFKKGSIYTSVRDCSEIDTKEELNCVHSKLESFSFSHAKDIISCVE